MALQDLPDDYGLDVLPDILDHVRGRRTAIDIGAHRGIYTHYLLRKFDKVLSFEPVKELYEQIDNPDKYQLALGNIPGRVSICPGEKNTGQGHICDGDTVSIARLDDFHPTKVDFIKIDVEGYEYFVIKGAEMTLVRDKPALLLENNGLCERYGIEAEEIHDLLTNLGYYRIDQWRNDVLYIM